MEAVAALFSRCASLQGRSAWRLGCDRGRQSGDTTNVTPQMQGNRASAAGRYGGCQGAARGGDNAAPGGCAMWRLVCQAGAPLWPHPHPICSLHLRCLQEPALVTVFVKAPTWEAVGGDRLMEAVLDAGAVTFLALPVFEVLQSGPLRSPVDWWLVLRGCITAADWEWASTLVRHRTRAVPAPVWGRLQPAWHSPLPERWTFRCSMQAAHTQWLTATMKMLLHCTLTGCQVLAKCRQPSGTCCGEPRTVARAG